MSQPVKPILFLHIPKTAGSTFHSILNDQYPITKQIRFYSNKETERLIKMSPNKKKLLQVVKGHFQYGLHEHLPDYAYYLLFLRQPVKRLISSYEYVWQYKKHPMHEEMMQYRYSFDDFLLLKRKYNDNAMIRYLCGDHSMPYGGVNQEHLEKAKAVLLHPKVLTGLTERFDESIIYFKHTLNWKTPYYIKQNTTHNKIVVPETFSASTLEVVNQCTYYDLQLYQFAQSLLEEKTNQLGASFQEELSRFKTDNPNHFSLYGQLVQRIKSNLCAKLQR